MKFSEWVLKENLNNVAALTDAVIGSRLDDSAFLILADALEERGDEIHELIRMVVDMNNSFTKKKGKDFLELYSGFYQEMWETGISFDSREYAFSFANRKDKRKRVQVDNSGLTINHPERYGVRAGKQISATELPENALRALILMLVKEYRDGISIHAYSAVPNVNNYNKRFLHSLSRNMFDLANGPLINDDITPERASMYLPSVTKAINNLEAALKMFPDAIILGYNPASHITDDMIEQALRLYGEAVQARIIKLRKEIRARQKDTIYA